MTLSESISLTWEQWERLCKNLQNSDLNVKFYDGGFYGIHAIFIDGKQVGSASYEYEEYTIEKKYWEVYL